MAKELDVESSSIIKKCQDEGLDVKNHMSTISVGLAATIREWFSEGENVTTVESAGKVDLHKVKVRPKSAVSARKVKDKKTTVQQDPADADAATVPAEAVEESPAEVLEQQIIPSPEPEVEIPAAPEKKPTVIMPAGPILGKPTPAKLSGPTVVRVEAPEPLDDRRPKMSRPPYKGSAVQPLLYGPEQRIASAAVTDKKHPDKRHKTDRTSGRKHGGATQDLDAIKNPRLVEQRRQRDIEERRARLDAAGGERMRVRPVRKIADKSSQTDASAFTKPSTASVTEPITIKDLSAALAVKSSDIIAKLMRQNIMVTANQTINADLAEQIAIELGVELIIQRKKMMEEQIKQECDNRERKNLTKRSVVATMLGHVDHGKTSLLDKIRSTHVTAGEAGGITQHIGAYQVAWGDKRVTFLDTPGHAAFTAMRARGANMTDVVVLVVAADDGVMPQTIEAMHHAKAANVPVIVALNKCDLHGFDINRIYAQLAENGLAPVEWSGQTEVVKTSAVTGMGIDDLLEHLDYVTDLLELKADDTIPATGWVVEAKMSPQRGPVATLLIKEGQLNRGDIVLAGGAFGRVKAMKNSYGKGIKTATSSMPVEITGLNGVPAAGDRFYCLDDINKAKSAAEESVMLSRESLLVKRTRVTLDNLFSQIEAGNVKELNIIIKADVHGSVDVLTKYLSELSTAEVKIKILHAASGGITESDVVLAEASNAIIIGFNVVTDEIVGKMAEAKGVDIRLYTIIYRITEDLKKSMVGLLEPQEQEKAIGRAVVRNTFKVSKVGTVAGCLVNSGSVTKHSIVRLIRESIIIRDGMTIESLKHIKDDVREVKAGMECGIKIAKFDDIKINDTFDFYEIIEVARTL